MRSIAEKLAPVEQGERILVVYFSQGSATKRVAEDLAFLLGAGTERIIETKSRKGFFGFLGAGADSAAGKSTEIERPLSDPSAYDAVVVCTPVWAWKLSPPVRTWLGLMKARLPSCAFVVVSAATAPEKIVAMMEAASGKKASAYVGFMEKDFAVGNRESYVGKLSAFVAAFH